MAELSPDIRFVVGAFFSKAGHPVDMVSDPLISGSLHARSLSALPSLLRRMETGMRPHATILNAAEQENYGQGCCRGELASRRQNEPKFFWSIQHCDVGPAMSLSNLASRRANLPSPTRTESAPVIVGTRNALRLRILGRNRVGA
jgi:hypothetical protein